MKDIATVTKKETSSISADEASKIFKEVIHRIKKWKKEEIAIKEIVYKLILTNAYSVLGYKNQREMLKGIQNATSLDRSTINDYKNVALIEIEQDLKPGEWDTETVLTFRSKTTDRDRKILRFLLDKEEVPITKKIVLEKKEQYEKDRLNGEYNVKKNGVVIYKEYEEEIEEYEEYEEEIEDYEEEIDGSLDLLKKRKDRARGQVKVTAVFEHVIKRRIDEKQDILNLLYPKSRANKYAAFVLNGMDYDQIIEFREMLKDHCEGIARSKINKKLQK